MLFRSQPSSGRPVIETKASTSPTVASSGEVASWAKPPVKEIGLAAMHQQKRLKKEKIVQSVLVMICELWPQIERSYGVRLERNKTLSYTIPRGEHNGANGSSKFQATLAVKHFEHGPSIMRAENSKFPPKPTMTKT